LLDSIGAGTSRIPLRDINLIGPDGIYCLKYYISKEAFSCGAQHRSSLGNSTASERTAGYAGSVDQFGLSRAPFPS
jgi:hypothetical protein